MFIPDEIEKVRNFFFNNVDFNSIKTLKTDKIYISRKLSSRRKFSDENAMESFFEDQGYKTVQMEKLSIFEQIGLMRNTKVLAAMTGAGLINIMFMPRNSVLLDLTNELYKTRDQYKFRVLDKVQVKGRNQPLVVYEIFEGDTDALIERKLGTQADYEEALRLYYNRKFTQANLLIAQALAQDPDDRVLQYHQERIAEAVARGVPDDWTGVEVLVDEE